MSRKENTSKARRERQPVGTMRKNLSLDQKTMGLLEKEGLVPRWVNDEKNGSRIKNFIDGGYDFISSDGNVIVGDTVSREDANKRIQKRVGTNKDGSPKIAYLMAIRKEFYDEDQAKKEEQNKMVDDAIRGGNAPGVTNHGVKPEAGGTYNKNIQYSP